MVLLLYKFRLFLLTYCLVGCAGLFVKAQNINNNVLQPVSLRFTYQFMHSTHKNNFNGVSIDADYHFSKCFATGIGIQYAATPRHPDNGWTLTNLHLLPLYVNSIYTFNTTHTVQPYIHVEAGISFNHYHKLDTAVSSSPTYVSETGLYLSGNGGVSFAVSPHTHVFVEMGYKGYKHSANALDVNPHGFTMRTGIEL